MTKRPMTKRLMTRISRLGLALMALILIACSQSEPPSNTPAVKPNEPQATLAKAASPSLVDPNATPETRALYRNLFALQGKQVLFGHQDSLAYGFHWTAEPDRSDVKDVTGSFPAVYGWDLGHLEKVDAQNLDGVSFELMRESIKKSFARGGVITISWHLINPVTGGGYNDTSAPAVAEILPGGSKHEVFKTFLDALVEFNQSLVVDGVQVPIIFRPWHEHNGEWFWWGKGHVTEDDYIQLWRFTVEYIRDEKQQHNLIYAFSPDRSRMNLDSLEADYLYAYPGDDYVDVIGFDNYWDLGHPANTASLEEQREHFVRSLTAVSRIAQEKGKLAALSEGGAEAIPDPEFWTGHLLKGLEANEDTRRISWVLVWRNATNGGYNSKHHYVPYPGHASADDFVRFKQRERVLFEDELPPLYR